MRKLLKALKFIPRTAVWEITLRCNLSCLHCGSRAGAARGDELSTEEALDLADQAADLGLPHITLSGGEPLVRRDWHRIARRLSDRGLRVTVISNGTLVDEELVALARESGLRNFIFSIDGLEQDHDRIRNRPGTFALVRRATEICREQDFSFAVVSHVNRLNMGYLDRLFEQVRDLGAFAWQVQPGIPFGNYLDNPKLLFLPEDVPRAYRSLARIFERADREGGMTVHAADSIGYFGDVEQTFREGSELGFWYGCTAGCQVVGFEANGNIKPCLSMQNEEFVVGNIRDQALREIWENDENFAFNRCFEPEMLEGFCADCRYGEICRAGCRWQALASSGSMFDNKYCYYRVVREQEVAKEDDSEEPPPMPSL